MVETLLPGLAALHNVHPMFVHFPIAFFLGALAMELVAIWVHERFHFVATWMLYLAALSAVVTATTGFLAMNQIAAASGGHAAPGHWRAAGHGGNRWAGGPRRPRGGGAGRRPGVHGGAR